MRINLDYHSNLIRTEFCSSRWKCQLLDFYSNITQIEHLVNKGVGARGRPGAGRGERGPQAERTPAFAPVTGQQVGQGQSDGNAPDAYAGAACLGWVLPEEPWARIPV